jgi:hypothetical protein
MDQDPNRITPGAATDEPVLSFNPDPAAVPAPGAAPPHFRSPEEEVTYWRAFADGVRAAGAAAAGRTAHPHLPPTLHPQGLTRDDPGAALVSPMLAEPWPLAPAPVSPRSDGWTEEKSRIFLRTLAATGSVADACRACGMSRDSAYAYRGRAAGQAFGLAWEAAQLLARRAIADDLMARAVHGVVDRVYRNGELVAERHRHDNRLAMALLTRLDRAAEGQGARGPEIAAVADEFDRFLDVLPQGNRGAEAFLAARFLGTDGFGETIPPQEPESVGGAPAPSGSEQARFARLAAYEAHGAALAAEVDTSDLDPAEMEGWSDAQCARAAFSGFLAKLPEAAWPEAVRAGETDADGTCKLRKLYLRYHPEGPPRAQPSGPPRDDFEGCSMWEEADGWVTDFPPLEEPFNGWEEGDAGEPDYRRELSEMEKSLLGVDESAVLWARDDRIRAQRAALLRYLRAPAGTRISDSGMLLFPDEDEEDDETDESELEGECGGGEGEEEAQHLDEVPGHPADAVEAFAAIAAALRKRSEGG